MSNVIRVFVEKREGFDVEARHMLVDLRDNLGLTKLTGLRLLVRYDIEGLSAEEFIRARGVVFSEPNADDVYDEEFTVAEGWRVFAMEYLPGQYDQRADSRPPSASSCSPRGSGPGCLPPGWYAWRGR